MSLPILKVVVLGDPGVGKTALVNRFVNGACSSERSGTGTSGGKADFIVKETEINGQAVILHLWDAPVPSPFDLSSSVCLGADCCVLVYDLNNWRSFESLNTAWRQQFLYHARPYDASTFPFVVLGNKCDVEKRKRQILPQRVTDWCQSRGFTIRGTSDFLHFETSARDGTNIEDAFQCIVENALREKDEIDLVEGNSLLGPLSIKTANLFEAIQSTVMSLSPW